MNILGSLQRWGTSLLNLVTEGPAEVEAKEAGAEESDGPGAGGGYETKDSVDIQSDGPGAGGGYDSKALIVVDSDGPGAGGGYDGDGDSDDDGPGAGGGYKPTQNLVILSDGPGAGGGYSGISSVSVPVDLMSYQATTEEISRVIGSTSTTYTHQESDYFLTDGLAAKSYVDGQKSVAVNNKGWTILPELHVEATAAPKESQQKSGDKE